MSHVGSCFCGAVEMEVTGAPEAMGYCHCRSCRSWSGGPVNAFSLWKPEAVRVTKGAEHVATFQKTETQPAPVVQEVRRAPDGQSSAAGPRRRIRRDDPDLDFAPGVHVNYAETVLPMRDGLPKLKDFPAEYGGSGADDARSDGPRARPMRRSRFGGRYDDTACQARWATIPGLWRDVPRGSGPASPQRLSLVSQSFSGRPSADSDRLTTIQPHPAISRTILVLVSVRNCLRSRTGIMNAFEPPITQSR